MPGIKILQLKYSKKEARTAAFGRDFIEVWEKLIEGLHLISSDPGSWPKPKFTI